MERVVQRLEAAGAAVSGVCLPAIMVVISLDAILRYLFNAPLQWAFDVVGYYLMVFAAFPVLSRTFSHGDHIAIGVVRARLPPRLRGGLDAAAALLALVVFATIAAGSWDNTIHAYAEGEYLPSYFNLPLWISHLPIALGTTLLVLRLALHALALLAHGHDPHVVTAEDGGGE
jgi:TRAP-type C4-dicarboxylate transport system permease small subunit